MTDEPMDIEAESGKAAKALGLKYSELETVNFWQRDKQTEEARDELDQLTSGAACQVKSPSPATARQVQGAQPPAPTGKKERAATPHTASTHSPTAADATTPADTPRRGAFETVPGSSESPEHDPTLFARGRPQVEDPGEASATLPNRQESNVPFSTRARAFWLRLTTFLKNRAERKQAVGVDAQKEEKSRQMSTALLCGAALVLLAGLAVWLTGGAQRTSQPPVRVYKSDFRLEPEALDKMSYQKQYDDKLEDVTQRLHTMEELAARLEREVKAASDKRNRAAAGETKSAGRMHPVNSLPDFTASGRGGEEAARLAGASQGPAPTVPEGPRLKRVTVSDPGDERRAIASAARERYTPVRMKAADTLIAGNRARHEAAGTYLPAGSFARAVVLAGATVSTGGTSASNPVPMLFEVTDLAQLPNAFRSNVKACFVTADATGDLSSERIWIRLQRLSCMTKSGKAFDARVQGYATGDDGKTGVRARLVTRSGQAIASALLTGSISGLGKAVSLSAQNTTTYTSGAVGTAVTDSFKAGLGEGLESALDRIADYYIRLADKIFPCLEIDSGRRVDLILSQGLTIQMQEPEPKKPAADTAPPVPTDESVNNAELFGRQMLERNRPYTE